MTEGLFFTLFQFNNHNPSEFCYAKPTSLYTREAFLLNSKLVYRAIHEMLVSIHEIFDFNSCRRQFIVRPCRAGARLLPNKCAEGRKALPCNFILFAHPRIVGTAPSSVRSFIHLFIRFRGDEAIAPYEPRKCR